MGNFIDVITNIIHEGSDGEVLGNDDVIFVDSGVKLEGLSAGVASGTLYDGIEAAQASGDGVTANIDGSVVGSLNGLAVDHVGHNNITVTTSGSVVSIVGGYGVMIGGLGSNAVVNDGLIEGPAGGVFLDGGENTLTNGGTITSSAGPSIKLDGSGNTINNTGLVNNTGLFAVIEIDTSGGGNSITNSGQIAGYAGVMLDTAANNTDFVDNSGIIHGASFGVWESEQGDGSLVVTNSGTITAAGLGIQFVSTSGDSLTNTGKIASTAETGVYELAGPIMIHNSGSISGLQAGVVDNFGAGSVIHNAANGTITSDTLGISLANEQNVVANNGEISGGFTGLSLLAGGTEGKNTVSNSGTITAGTDDAILIEGAQNSITNSGTIAGRSTGIHLETGSSTSGGNGITNDGEISGRDAIFINDGAGTSDTIHNGGMIRGSVIPGGSGIADGNGSSLNLINDGKISGYDAILFGSGTGQHDTLDNSGTIAGVGAAVEETGSGTLHVFNSGHIAGNIALGGDGSIYNGVSGTLDGAVFGGSGGDTIKGGADGEALNGGAGNDLIKGGAGDDTITGGAGADKLVGGGGSDTFVYTGFADSHGPSSHDTIVGFDALSDTFNFGDTVTGVDKAITSGTLDKAAFNTDMQAILTSTALHAHHAVLFTANAGDLAGHTFLIVDGNGTAGFQPTADCAIELTQSTHLTGLSADNFI